MSSIALGPDSITHLPNRPITRVQSSDNPHFRKVSLADHVNERGHDNHAFDSPNRSRKVSAATSEHAEIGPVRKKSILHMSNNAFDTYTFHGGLDVLKENGKLPNGDRLKKQSTTESVHSKVSNYSRASARTRFSEVDDEGSWWYTFCIACRPQESHPSWSPTFWSKVCPYPFCPTYRQFSRLLALILIGFLAWCILYAIVGDTAAPPNGLLFQLIILSLGAHMGGWLMSLTTLPALIGMLFTGILFQNVGVVNINEDFSHITKELRQIALVIILIRAGLDLDPSALKRLKFTVIKVGLIPWVVEAIVVAVLSKFFLGLAWSYGILLGCIVAAVSPAVVVPCLFRLRIKGYGVAKGIPTLIIAIAGIDDATSVAIFGIIKSIMFSHSSTTTLIIQGPVSILGGIGFGIVWGLICNFAPERHDPFVIPLRILMLLAGGMFSVFGSELIGYGGAGPLACVTAAFVCLVCWSRQGWEIEDNPATTAFEIFWMLFEPILFGVTGSQIKLKELDENVVYIGLGVLIAASVVRILATVVVGIGCNLNLKEKIFISVALMSKATVQIFWGDPGKRIRLTMPTNEPRFPEEMARIAKAALGPSALGCISDSTSEEYQWAQKVQMICILSIMLTAPTGAILITLLGPRLLTKTKIPIVQEGWRSSHRPSIRDISIIDEEEERDDPETVPNSPVSCHESGKFNSKVEPI